MKLGIVICSCNRAKYLQECFDSLRRANIPDNTLVIVSDDCSTDPDTKKLLQECELTVLNKEKKGGIWDSMTSGVDFLFSHGCDIVINLDSDAVVANNFVEVLLSLRRHNEGRIVTGFNSKTRNKDGSARHTVIGMGDGYELKKSVGGINMVFDKELYEKYIKPALVGQGRGGDNWDRQACIAAMKDDKPIVCSVPSVVNHIGVVSAMGHAGGGEPMDIAEDFKPLNLPMVSLVCVTGNDKEGLDHAISISTRHINFGSVKSIYVPSISSKEKYNKFIFNGLVNLINTPYILIVQPDGYLLNWKAWSDEFLKYDFIGAWWNWYKDGKGCGNGGFSLRSTKLHKILQNDPNIVQKNDHLIRNFEEDHNIGRIYREYLESNHGIKFAPKEICDQFSIEAFAVRPPGNKYNNSFGFHGWNVDFAGAQIEHIPQKSIKQFAR